MRVVTVIPARHASVRFPGKPLALILGKPMIQWVYERTREARGVDLTCVATDDERIAAVIESIGGKAVFTSPAIASGTDRVAAVSRQIPADVYVNVQGDEPLLSAAAVEQAVETVMGGRFSMGTLMTPFKNSREVSSPDVVKVIADQQGRAVYFSRLPIPYGRQAIPDSDWVPQKHVGLYVYTRATLQRLTSLPPARLEQAEGLEQLRALENGIDIGIRSVDLVSVGVDTQDDLVEAERHLEVDLRNG